MSCFCLANLDLLPSLSIDASLNLSASAQAAFDLYAQLSLGLPNFPAPTFALPNLDLDLDIDLQALASLTAMAQLRAQAMASLGIDLTASLGVTALARLCWRR